MRIHSPLLGALAVAAVAAPLAASLPAAAQGWQVYSFSDAGFAIQLPAAPTATKLDFKTASGASVPATAYILRQPDIIYSVTVADYRQAGADQAGALAAAVKSLGATGELKLDVQERIDQQFGRQLSVIGKDGARSTISVFFVNGKLYELEGKSLPPDPDSGSGKAIRFQQSLEFIGLGAEANRPENRIGGGPGGGGPGRGGPGRGPGGRGGPGGGPPPQAFEACAGKAAGDAVRLNTPQGEVAATCALVARPNQPPGGPNGPPPG